MASNDAASLAKACKAIKLMLVDCDGVLTDGRIIHASDGTELKCFSTKDGMGVNLWQRAGFAFGIITGGTSEVVKKRARDLCCDEVHQGILKKNEVVEEILERRGLKPKNVVYIGDDVNDLPVLPLVGLFMAPADSTRHVLEKAHHVLGCSGGRGAVREAIEIILSQKGILDELVSGYVG